MIYYKFTGISSDGMQKLSKKISKYCKMPSSIEKEIFDRYKSNEDAYPVIIYVCFLKYLEDSDAVDLGEHCSMDVFFDEMIENGTFDSWHEKHFNKFIASCFLSEFSTGDDIRMTVLQG